MSQIYWMTSAPLPQMLTSALISEIEPRLGQSALNPGKTVLDRLEYGMMEIVDWTERRFQIPGATHLRRQIRVKPYEHGDQCVVGIYQSTFIWNSASCDRSVDNLQPGHTSRVFTFVGMKKCGIELREVEQAIPILDNNGRTFKSQQPVLS
jgi:hypothetical protein